MGSMKVENSCLREYKFANYKSVNYKRVLTLCEGTLKKNFFYIINITVLSDIWN